MYALFWILIIGLISYFPFQHLWQLPISLKNELTVLLLTSNPGSQMVPQLCQTIVLINAFPALHKPLVALYPGSSPHKAKPLAYLFTAASSDIICAQISQKLLLLLSPRLIKTLPFFSCTIFEQCSGMVYSFNVPWIRTFQHLDYNLVSKQKVHNAALKLWRILQIYLHVFADACIQSIWSS